MSSLSQYHPFRDNVNKTANAGDSSSPNASSEAKGNDDDKPYQPWLSFKTKMRIVVFTVVVLAIWYVISSFFQENPELEKGFYSSVQGIQKKASKKEIDKNSLSIFDEHDLDERGRSITETKSKVGFFQRIFCKGGKKASFCS